MEKENSKIIFLKFLVDCNQTSMGDRLFIKIKSHKYDVNTELFTCPDIFPQWESHTFSIKIEEIYDLSFNAFIQKSDGKITSENEPNRNLKQSTFLCPR